ncbi:hypothetical protein DOZ80_24830 [Pseudomonas fluorescens]|uniref:Uncharacterized protein n=1 Tax=Pseudomonas fluorescens TaxID=294 RepID=A0A327MZ71_PSEFL|nr:hypothetical protein [Pseudomonas fluorescens]RAI65418.1 hypothetical protein DOZ80_24830 [Pseudomonas fluorescens]
MHFLRTRKSPTFGFLAILFLSAMPLYSLAHDEHAVESTTIEYFEIETSPDASQKMSHLKIQTENEYRADEQESDFPLSGPLQGDTDTSYANSRILL